MKEPSGWDKYHQLSSWQEPDGTTTTYRVPFFALLRTPPWSPGEGPPPLSLENALPIALDWLKAHHPEFDQFRPTRFDLSLAVGGRGETEVGLEHCLPSQVAPTRIVEPLAAGIHSHGRHRGRGSRNASRRQNMTISVRLSSPNPRLQRTPSAPLSRQPLGGRCE